jgi:hypothetical protein
VPVTKPKQFPFPEGHYFIQKTTNPLLFPGVPPRVSQGSTPGEANDKCIIPGGVGLYLEVYGILLSNVSYILAESY